MRLGSSTLADLGQDGVVLNVVAVIGLDLDGDTAQGALQGILGGGVNHLGLERQTVSENGLDGKVGPGKALGCLP